MCNNIISCEFRILEANSLGGCCFFVGAGVPLVSGRFQLGGAEAFIVLRFWEWGSRVVFGMSQACLPIIIHFRIAFVWPPVLQWFSFFRPPTKRVERCSNTNTMQQQQGNLRIWTHVSAEASAYPPGSEHHSWDPIATSVILAIVVGDRRPSCIHKGIYIYIYIYILHSTQDRWHTWLHDVWIRFLVRGPMPAVAQFPRELWSNPWRSASLSLP